MENLIPLAKDILRQNRRNGFTIPTRGLYPFQWNWDSGFISLGHHYLDIHHSIQELQSLFDGQWENGMVPHIIFHNEDEKTYFPNCDFWKSSVNKGAPETPKTSGITQPPVTGFILENLLKKNPKNEDLKNFIKMIFPKVVHSHRFFYQYRDPNKEGLFFIFHPWESGRDNSPLWNESYQRIKIENNTLPYYQRRDSNIDKDQRPSSFHYDCYVYLLLLGRKHRYEDERIFQDSPLLIQDTLMNAILIKSNESLINIGTEFGFDVGEIKEWKQQSITSYRQKLWNEKLDTFVSYDMRGEKQIALREIGSMASLFAEIPNRNQADTLNQYLLDLHHKNFYLCPSFDVQHPLFDSKRYWQGPVWPQMNWLIYHGLMNYGFHHTADLVRSDLIELVDKLGFYEYFEPQKEIAKELKNGYGGGAFSWTAACIIDFFYQNKAQKNNIKIKK